MRPGARSASLRVGQPGDAPKVGGVRLYKYDLPVSKTPAAVGWQGKDGRQAVVLSGKKYTYYPALVDRQENGSLTVTTVWRGLYDESDSLRAEFLTLTR